MRGVRVCECEGCVRGSEVRGVSGCVGVRGVRCVDVRVVSGGVR